MSCPSIGTRDSILHDTERDLPRTTEGTRGQLRWTVTDVEKRTPEKDFDIFKRNSLLPFTYGRGSRRMSRPPTPLTHIFMGSMERESSLLNLRRQDVQWSPGAS